MQNRAFFFTNKGHIANPFKIRNYTLWQRYKRKTEVRAYDEAKPVTAPERTKQMEESLIQMGPVSPTLIQRDPPAEQPQRYYHFKTTIASRKPLSNMGDRKSADNIAERKRKYGREIEREVERVVSFQNAHISHGFIEYLTEYNKGSLNRSTEPKTERMSRKRQLSINVLREKLKSKYRLGGKQ